jgi:NDP-sugar pyrophosphorylase family protein
MKHVLICPGRREAVEPLAESAPLAAVPLLGESLVEYWLAHLAASGLAKEVRVLAHDRPEYIDALVGNGARWGLQVEVTAETRELTPAQVQIKYQKELPVSHDSNSVIVLDHFPGLAELPLFTSYADWFAGLLAWLPRAKTCDRVGVKETQPGVWVGTHSSVARDAQFQAPCWIGTHCCIGPKAVIGPMTIIEDGTLIEAGAEISHSVVGPDTLVGQFTEVRESFAWGNMLINWKSNSSVRITDSFLLCALRRPPALQSAENPLTRLVNGYLREDLHLFWKHLLKEG